MLIVEDRKKSEEDIVEEDSVEEGMQFLVDRDILQLKWEQVEWFQMLSLPLLGLL